MPVAKPAVSPLQPVAERFALKSAAVEADAAGENSVGVRRARKANPAHVRHGGSEGGVVAQVPTDLVPVDLQPTGTGIFLYAIVVNLQVEGARASRTERKPLLREAPKEALRPPVPGETRR